MTVRSVPPCGAGALGRRSFTAGVAALALAPFMRARPVT